jgi:4-hydroxybenzoate polyprenyltransferase
MKKVFALFKLFRPDQWIKNLFLFLPIFFAGELSDVAKLKTLFIAFMAFSCVASAIYIINDVKDVKQDKDHPEKRHRPIAAGLVSKELALFCFVLLLVAGGLLAYLTYHNSFYGILGAYFIINIGYTFGLKKVSIVDILIVASGFVLRTIAGGLVVSVEISHWMVIMIFLLALFLVLAKRRDDLLVFRDSGNIMRKSIEQYNLEYINSLLIMISGIMIVAYLMYVISPEVVDRFNSPYIYFTTVFVVAGVLRYLQITFVENKSGSPTKILYTDNFIRVVVIGWIVSFYIIIYRL